MQERECLYVFFNNIKLGINLLITKLIFKPIKKEHAKA